MAALLRVIKQGRRKAVADKAEAKRGQVPE
jgi:hypothetical protein